MSQMNADGDKKRKNSVFNPRPSATSAGRSPSRVAVVCDTPEEGWASMDLTGEMVLRHLAEGHAEAFSPERVCPPFRGRLARWPAARNIDRLVHRFRDAPRALRAE